MDRYEIKQGDALEVLRSMPSESVHCVITSPPYFGLRDYGTGLWDGGEAGCDHKQGGGRDNTAHLGNVGSRNEAGDAFRNSGRYVEQGQAFKDVCGKCGATRQDHQMGLEASPQEYLERMVGVFREVRRVLRRDGTCWVNMGDSYAGSNGTGGTPGDKQFTNVGSRRQPPDWGKVGLKPKDLMMMPARLALALQADGWYLRSEIVWAKLNPMPESVSDRCTKSHEMIYLLARSSSYFYDAQAIAEDNSPNTHGGLEPNVHKLWAINGASDKTTLGTHHAGRNKRSVWTIPTEAYSAAHFATFPTKLVEPCILAGTSARGCCSECGAPWRRVVEIERIKRNNGGHSLGKVALQEGGKATSAFTTNEYPHSTTTGWRPTCAHSAPPQPCTVLDPFAGSGTTLLVALRHGRRALGIELNPEYIEMAHRRIEGDERAMQQHMDLEAI